jgi:hypothetical protein
MAAHSLFLIALACLVSAQTPALSTWAATPLVSLSFPKPTDAPQKVWPDVPAFERGPQTGYNICNSTTEGGNSLCQTAYVNDLSGAPCASYQASGSLTARAQTSAYGGRRHRTRISLIRRVTRSLGARRRATGRGSSHKELCSACSCSRTRTTS